MIQTGIESRVKIQDIISNQLPEYVLDESPKTLDFLKQYYISQEYQGGPVDVAENLDQYLKLDNLTPEVIVGSTTLSGDITATSDTISVSSTKGFPNQYGLLKIDNEVITYTGLTANTFIGCVRGFSGITSYHQDLNEEELVFSTTTASSHKSESNVQNLSSLFLSEFYKKIKFTYTPGFEDRVFDSKINVGNFIKESRSFYESKGTDDSFRILFNVLYGETPRLINLEDYLIKPSDAEFIRREVCVAEVISGDPTKIVGQTLIKTTDEATNASISSVEAFTRNQKQYFKLGLFVGYAENSNVKGNFTITPSSKVLENVSVGSSVISVDSTIGFGQTGTIYSGNNIITYTEKSVNQFLGCSGIDSTISVTDNIFSNDTYFSYENGNVENKVVLRLTGVLSNFVQRSKSVSVDEGQIITVKNVGSLVKNPEQNKTYKEIFANSWIYNTSSSVNISSFIGATNINGQLTNSTGVTFDTTLDRSQFKKGDLVEFVDISNNTVIYPTSTSDLPFINSDIDYGSKSISIGNLNSFIPNVNGNYKLRRKIHKTNSSTVNLKYGNDSIISDVQNVYFDTDNFAYVASNSIPSWGNGLSNNSYTYQITKKLNSISISSNGGSLEDQDTTTGLYTSILFDTDVPFINGEKIEYRASNTPLTGLLNGSYYVKVSSTNPKKIKLFTSASFLDSDSNSVQFASSTSTLETHTFISSSQKSETINPQKVLKKFALNPNIKNGTDEITDPGKIGMLINGVEISNYKTFDKIYFGPLEKVDILNAGSGFDVISPPSIEVSAGLGTTALVQPVVTGTIEDIFIDNQNFDIEEVLSINVTGGNVSGGLFEPVINTRRREVSFDARRTTDGGGINTTSTDPQITFLTDHNFVNGEEITYKNNGNSSITIGLGVSTLIDNSNYFAKVDNNTTIKLFNTFEDLQSGINTISFESSSLNGIQKFATLNVKNTISEIKVLDGGKFTNRKLLVKPSGISTSNGTINFINHGFSDGEIIEYSSTGTPISGLTTTNQYYILKNDDNSFRLSDAGIGGTISSNYEQDKFVKLTSVGTDLHQFKYPDIQVSVEFTSVGLGTTTQSQSIVATPIIKGSLEQIYLYEEGTKYGSDILNVEKKPSFTFKNGRSASLEPVIVNGSINEVNLQFGGFEYFSVPELIVSDPTGSGTGAKLRAVITNEKISDVKILNAGIGYSTSSSIEIIPSGTGAILNASIRSLTVNQVEKLPTQQNEILSDEDGELSYSVSGYFDVLRSSFNDDGSDLSGIIGWAYDGNPIYGPYATVDPTGTNPGIKTMTTGYTKSASNISDRPSVTEFPLGFFVEDYKYDNQNGDLDRNNGRFAKTIDFPNGVYAYHATIDINGNPEFPYFIGNSFRSNTIKQNKTLNQEFDFNNSSLSRNTLPYKVSELNADNDFIIESNEIKRQKISVESVQEGSISSVEIVNSGDNYKVNDALLFDNTNTNGGGISARVSSIKGKTINNINTSNEVYDNVLFTWRNDGKITATISPFHTLSDNDYITISGFTGISSSQLVELNNYFKINVPTIPNSGLTTEIVSSSGAGTTEIYVTQIPPGVSVGSSIGIGTETLEILNVYQNKNVLRVKRGDSGIAHNAGTSVSFKSRTFTIDKKLDYFDSKSNDRIYFNPKESVGLGTTAGVGYSTSFSFGNELIEESIPMQRISLLNHPFQTNQQLTFETNGNGNILISDTPSGQTYDLPATVFAVNKSPNTIGIKTIITSDEIYFVTNGDDNDEYYLESNFDQQTAKVEKIISTISISTAHGLTAGDQISLNVKPNLSVGIGTSTSVKVSRNSLTGNLEIDPIGFSSSAVNSSTDQISITSHNLNTGDKVHYYAEPGTSETISGLQTGSYYVYKVNSDIIKLSETLINSTSNPPIVVSFASTGGSSQNISKINPRIESVKNNNLLFDLSDSSLSGYEFKVYYDQDFNNEFVSTGSTDVFNLESSGTIGSSNATFTIKNSPELPRKLYYSLEKSGFISSSDTDVNNYSEILFVDSLYNQNYTISNLGVSTFQISLQKSPERLSYASTECDNLEYTTTSLTASGPANKIHLLSGGSGYKKLPSISSITSANGENLLVSLNSNDIGIIKSTRIINEGFEYSSDKTLQPEAFISPKIVLKDSNTIGIATIVSGGSGYVSAPQIIVVNNDTRELLDNGSIIPTLAGNSIVELKIDASPKGISDQSAELFTINNTNGISIKQVQSSNTGIFTCILTTPSIGFSTDTFEVGEQVFIEGIQKFGTDGDGFNSSDYGYKFFEVTNYKNKTDQTLNPPINDDEVTISISGLGTNTGIAKTVQDSFGNIISKNNYPTFSISLAPSIFELGEKLLSNDQEIDLEVIASDKSGNLKVFGSYDLSANERIEGKISGNVATIRSIEKYDGFYETKFSNRKDEGWEKETGKLSEDYQVLADNDYYQNLSYSINSKQQWKDIRTPVNSLVHSTGIKNFSDTVVMSDENEKIGIKTTSDTTTIIKDCISENRVDTINIFDLVKDVDLDPINNKSKFVKLKNKNLTNYNESKSNIVLKIDNIQDQFSSSADDPSEFKDLIKIDNSSSYNNYLFKVSDVSGKNQVQLTSLIYAKDLISGNIGILEKQSLVNVGSGLTTIDGEQYGDFSLEDDEFGDTYVRFTPKDPYDTEYDIKYIDKKFDNQLVGVGTTSIGFIDLTSRSQEVSAGTSSIVIGFATDKFESLHINAQVYKKLSRESNFVEVYLTHNGNDIFTAEFYFDTEDFSRSLNSLGSFDAYMDSGVVNLTYKNESNENVIAKTRIVGFGTTAVGVGTFRYILPDQPEGNERSAIYEAGFSTTTSGVSTSFLSLDKNLFDASKSLVEVGIGTTKSVQQIMMVQDGTDIYIQQSAFLSASGIGTFDTAIGIGTFGGEYDGNNVLLKFYPDSNFSGDLEIKSFSECLYSDVDILNQAPDLSYGTSIETVNTGRYLAINGDRINQDNFVLTSDKTPIFAKKFNPADTAVLNASTGKFSINNHFFSDGEELVYTPKSTFDGVSASPMTYKSSALAVFTTLPTQVFAVVDNNNNFSISTTKAGTAVTFTGLGSGNAHEFAMAKRNEKTLITIDNIAQYPIAFTKISQTLTGNDGGISATDTTFALSGISTISPGDILEIDDEYMKIINVGLGTTASGPITGIGSSTIVEVERGHVGSTAASHTDATSTRIYRGSYNIVGDSIFFTNPPRGNSNITRTENNLKFETSDFTGRVFLRKDYTTNEIFDDFSDEFTGIGRTFAITVGGSNTTGIGTTGGNGVVFINGIFQTPTTENNPLNNFSIIDPTSVGYPPSPVLTLEYTSGYTSNSSSGTHTVTANAGGSTTDIEFDVTIGLGPSYPIGATPTINDGGTGYEVGDTITVTSPSWSSTDVVFTVTRVDGPSSIIFSGIRTDNSDPTSLLISESDVNQNQLPRGGVIISLGSTGGQGYAPLVGAAVTAIINGSGTITGLTTGITGGTFGSGYNSIVSIGVSIVDPTGNGSGAVITASPVGTGGTLTFNITNGGSNYSNQTQIFVSEPSYENLEVTGVSRVGLGPTTDTGIGLLLNINVGASSTTGIGSTYHSVNNFNIARSGYSFRKGDVFKPVGLVTAAGLTSPLSEFELTVLEVFNDNFASWQFGELDYIDSVKNFQDGFRVVFPLFYNGSLLSFQQPEDSSFDLQNLLIIFLNGILQEPGESYVFDGGTSFSFSVAPKPEDKIDIFYYRGTRGQDDLQVNNVPPTLEKGDIIRIYKNDTILETKTQDSRTIFDLTSSDKFETSLYVDEGIDEINLKPMSWTKQKIDRQINGEFVSKKRQSIIAQIYPTAKIIKDVGTSDTEIFVDDISNFGYEESNDVSKTYTFEGIIIDGKEDPSPANITATIGAGGTVSSLTIDPGNSGSGYVGSTVNIKFQNPLQIDDPQNVGVGTTATATATVTNGAITATTITNPGFGYTVEPKTIVPLPNTNFENLNKIETIRGFSGNVTEIEAVTPTSGHSKALKFTLDVSPNIFNSGSNTLDVGFPILIKNTTIGSGVTSVDDSNAAVVGIGTTFVDNVYYVRQISANGSVGIITCNIDSGTDVTGLTANGNTGTFSWGRLSGNSIRSSSPIAIGVSGKTVDVGLSTFPTIQRRNEGLRDTGALPETLN
jgi:hypothetical protein